MGTISLDLKKAHAAYQHGDIIAVLSWCNDERALILFPARRAIGSPWFIVLESAAFKYDDPRHCARMAAKAAEVLGMDETTSTATRVLDIILNYLPDLIRMPHAPDPELMRGSFGNMQLRADGKVIRGEEVRLEKSMPEYEVVGHG